MAYNKTTWQNNVTDIDANNLNKIEQGIYDNSLVVDAVTNTINPTDTETYKTAELTEGQITDVIGVNDILIKGQTSQNGEPTPSSPVDVNVVSGSNVVNTSNKNLFIPTLKVDNTSIYVNDATVLLMKDEYTFIASGSDMYFGQVASTGATYSKIDGMKIYKNGNTKLSFLVTNTTFNRVHITAYNSQGVSLGYTAFNGTSGTYTFPENCEFATIRIGKNNAVSGTTYKTKVVVVYGDTIPSTYEPHQGKELPLDLPVENLFDKNNVEKYTGFTNGSDYKVAYNTATKSIIIPCKENTTYTVSKINGGNYDRFNIASFTTKPTAGTTASKYVGDNSLTSLTITTGPNDTYIMVLYYHTSETVYSENDILDSIQIEQGSKANAYTPYGTDPIELCKIGNYQDYFYKSGSKWYLHKEIGKFFSDKQSDWTYDNNGRYFRAIDNIVLAPNNDTVGTGKCNVGLVAANQTMPGNMFKAGLAIHSTVNRLYISSDVYGNITTTPTLLYYAYITPTNTEITNTTLISQLEAIYNAPLYEQTNITQENNDLPMVLDITACKDNINGIKAFIRK